MTEGKLAALHTRFLEDVERAEDRPVLRCVPRERGPRDDGRGHL